MIKCPPNASDASHAHPRVLSTGRRGRNATAGALNKKHMGSKLDDFLRKEGWLKELRAKAVKEVTAWKKKSRKRQDGEAL